MFAAQSRDLEPGAACAALSAFGFCISGRQGYRSRQNGLAWRIPLDWEGINPSAQSAFHWYRNYSANLFVELVELVAFWEPLTSAPLAIRTVDRSPFRQAAQGTAA
jgi:hypothetical protein